MIEALAFYLFAAILTLSALMVIMLRNPVYNVLFLVLAFFNAAGLFVLLGAEFVAMILVIVYVGAVAVLFLFVVMMLDIDYTSLRKGMARHAPVGVVMALVLLGELVMLARAWPAPPVLTASPDLTNTQAIGSVLYTDYIYPFQLAGLILLVAMMGAIVLTHRRRPDVRRQKIATQNAREPGKVIEMRNVVPGTGIEP